MDFSTAFIIILVVLGVVIVVPLLIGWLVWEMKREKRRKNEN